MLLLLRNTISSLRGAFRERSIATVPNRHILYSKLLLSQYDIPTNNRFFKSDFFDFTHLTQILDLFMENKSREGQSQPDVIVIRSLPESCYYSLNHCFGMEGVTGKKTPPVKDLLAHWKLCNQVNFRKILAHCSTLDYHCFLNLLSSKLIPYWYPGIATLY